MRIICQHSTRNNIMKYMTLIYQSNRALLVINYCRLLAIMLGVVIGCSYMYCEWDVTVV